MKCPSCNRTLKPNKKGLTCHYCNLKFTYKGVSLASYDEKMECKINEYLTVRENDQELKILVKDKIFHTFRKHPDSTFLDLCNEITSRHGYEFMISLFEELHEAGDHPTNTTFLNLCTEMTTWHEYHYNTNSPRYGYELMFSLLEELHEAGDPLAMRVINEEYIRQIENGPLRVALHLIEYDEPCYVKHLSSEEISNIKRRFKCHECKKEIQLPNVNVVWLNGSTHAFCEKCSEFCSSCNCCYPVEKTTKNPGRSGYLCENCFEVIFNANFKKYKLYGRS